MIGTLEARHQRVSKGKAVPNIIKEAGREDGEEDSTTDGSEWEGFDG
jgi:hypothetical protein